MTEPVGADIRVTRLTKTFTVPVREGGLRAAMRTWSGGATKRSMPWPTSPLRSNQERSWDFWDQMGQAKPPR